MKITNSQQLTFSPKIVYKGDVKDEDSKYHHNYSQNNDLRGQNRVFWGLYGWKYEILLQITFPLKIVYKGVFEDEDFKDHHIICQNNELRGEIEDIEGCKWWKSSFLGL